MNNFDAELKSFFKGLFDFFVVLLVCDAASGSAFAPSFGFTFESLASSFAAGGGGSCVSTFVGCCDSGVGLFDEVFDEALDELLISDSILDDVRDPRIFLRVDPMSE